MHTHMHTHMHTGEEGEGPIKDGHPPTTDSSADSTPYESSRAAWTLDPGPLTPYESSRAAVARLLGRARDLVANSPMSPIVQYSAAAVMQQQQQREEPQLAFPPSSDYILDPWHGLAWRDAASIARLQAEQSQVATQVM